MKPQIRQVLRTRLSAITDADAGARSRRAVKHVMALPEFAAAASVMIYLSTGDELRTDELAARVLQDRKLLIAPRVAPENRLVPLAVRSLSDDLESGYRGIREPRSSCLPVPLGEIDLLIVPGLAFDAHGRRLGRGGGYYDRLLAAPELRAATVGLCFELQILPDIPALGHDQHVAIVVTEEHVRRIERTPDLRP